MTDSCNFFISYNKANLRMAEWIAFELEKNGFSVVIQAWDSRAGSNFIAWMHETGIRCERTLAVLSPDYFTGKYSEMEWASALNSGKLVPVRVVDFDVPGLLGSVDYIDLVGLQEEEAIRTLLAGIQQGRAKSKTVSYPGDIAHAYRRPNRFPGSPPSVWNVPARNPNFTGREGFIDKLHDQLTTNEDGATVIQAFTGMGGIGKSQLALEFAHRFASDYDIIWWMRAENPVALAGQYASLSRELDLPEKDHHEQAVVIQAVKRALHGRPNCLLIFDNATEEDYILEYLPSGASGHVLITSRNTYWSRITSSVSVSTWPRDESVDFLIKFTKQNDAEGASSLAELLGDLPLALEQAAAFINKGYLSFQEYAERFTKRRASLWTKEKPPPDYEATVSTTFSIAIQEMSAKNPLTERMLSALAFLAPEDVPRKFLKSLREYEPFVSATDNVDSFDDSISELATYSLIKADKVSISLHRLVQAVIRDRLAEQAASWVKLSIKALAEAWPDHSHDHRTWPDCEQLLPHAIFSMKNAEVYSLETEELALLCNEVGLYLDGRAVIAEAESLYQKSVVLTESLYGKIHSSTATSYSNLAFLYYSQGRYKEAELLMQKTLSIDLSLYGEHHSDTAQSYNNLAVLYSTQSRYKEAEAFSQRALSLRKTLFGENNLLTASGYVNLGQLYGELGRYKEAEKFLHKALAIKSELLGEKHEEIAQCCMSLAGLYSNQGLLEQAIQFSKKAIFIDKNVLGENHPETATAYHVLAHLFHIQGLFEEAEPLLLKALAISRNIFGENHPGSAGIMKSLSNLYIDQGRYKEVEALIQKALTIIHDILGQNHPDTAIFIENLAYLYVKLERYEEAEPLYQKALAIREHKLGNNHPFLAVSLNSLAQVYKYQGRFEEAEPLYKKALAIQEEVLGEHHTDTCKSYNDLGALYRILRRYEESEPLYMKALVNKKKLFGENHPDIGQSYNNLAVLYSNQGLYEKAETYYLKALAIKENALGENHPETALSYHNFSFVLGKQGRYKEAVLLLEKTLSIYQRVYRKDHPSTNQVEAELSHYRRLLEQEKG